MRKYVKNRLPILFGCLLTLAFTELKAQSPSKLFFGGGFSIAVSEYLDINVSPLVGYNLTPTFAVGVLAKYEYISFTSDVEPYKASLYGGGVFARYDVSSLFLSETALYTIFVQTDYQYLYTKLSWKKTSYSDSYTEDRWYIGAGFSVPTGARSRFYAYISYDILSLLRNRNTEHSKPVVSVGYQF